MTSTVDGELHLDVSELRAADQKLGLGSSAAGAVAAAAAVMAHHGHDVSTQATRELVLRAALAGHHAVAPDGSGVDVAAAVWGEVQAFRREGSDVACRSVSLPDELELRVVWTGQSARTSDLLQSVRRWAGTDPAAFAREVAALSELGEAFVDDLQSGDGAGILDRAGQYGEAMGNLGAQAGAPIVTPILREIAELAAAHGGRAKPSGAGGGDVAVAFFLDRAAAAAFEAACADRGLRLLSGSLAGPGVLAASPIARH